MSDICNDCQDTASARLLDDEQVAKPEELEERGKFCNVFRMWPKISNFNYPRMFSLPSSISMIPVVNINILARILRYSSFNCVELGSGVGHDTQLQRAAMWGAGFGIWWDGDGDDVHIHMRIMPSVVSRL